MPKIPDLNPLVILMNALAHLSSSLCTARAVHPTVGSTAWWAAAGLCVVLGGTALPSLAADAPPTAVSQRAGKAAPKAATKAKVAPKKALPAELPPEPANDEQRGAAERVYYGQYQCEFKQVVQISPSEQHPAYVDLRFAKSTYLMKPVLSSTGAIRLEDVKGQTLMVQIASKSMLLNVQTGRRMVDECLGDRHLAEIQAAKQRAALEDEQASPSNAISASAKPAP